jgi:TonB-dependent starch-binding outer membrane protein SusC
LLVRGAFGFKAVNGKRIFHENVTFFPRNNLFVSAIDEGVMGEPVFSSYYLEDGDYVKLDNLTIGYNISGGGNSFLQGVRLYITATNLLTITGFSGTDPELGLNYFPADPNAETTDGPGVEPNFSYYPGTRSFTFGINANF